MSSNVYGNFTSFNAGHVRRAPPSNAPNEHNENIYKDVLDGMQSEFAIMTPVFLDVPNDVTSENEKGDVDDQDQCHETRVGLRQETLEFAAG